MNKLYAIFGIFVFVFLTLVVLLADTDSRRGKINLFSMNTRLVNESSYTLKNQETNAEFDDIKINSKSNINTSNVTLNNNLNKITSNDVKISNSKTNTSSYPSIHTPNIYRKDAYINIDNKSKQIEEQKPTFSINDIHLHPEDEKKIEKAGFKNISNISTKDLNSIANILNEPVEKDEYAYENIDWNTWKSRLINKITDDSAYIEELDYYPVDTPIYYSFKVHNNGTISDVIVISLVVVDSDKKKLADLIESYANKSIVKFPKGSKRKSVSLSSIMLLSNELKHSKPSDFNDIEKIKVKI